MIHDISALNMSRDRPCLSTWMLTIWHKIKAIYIYVLWFFIFFWIFLNFYSHLNLGQILGLTKVKTSLKHGNEKVSIWIILSLSKMKLLGGFWSFMFETQNHFSSYAWLHKTKIRVRGRYIHVLGGFWNFHVWNPNPLLFILDVFIRQKYRVIYICIWVDTWFVWFEYVQILFINFWMHATLSKKNFWMLTIWHKKTICF